MADSFLVGDMVSGWDELGDDRPVYGKVIAVGRKFLRVQEQEQEQPVNLSIENATLEQRIAKPTVGRPRGIPRDGTYGRGVKTVTVRVPEGSEDLVRRLLTDLPETLQVWREAATNTRDWTKFNRLISELESQYPELFEGGAR